MIKSAASRVVNCYHPTLDIHWQPFVAIVGGFNIDGTVNITLINHYGDFVAMQDVPVINAGAPTPERGFYCVSMPEATDD